MPVSDDLSKLCDVVKNDVVKKTVYDKLDVKVNKIDTNGFVLKTKYENENEFKKLQKINSSYLDVKVIL